MTHADERYKNGCVYKLWTLDSNLIYIGSTCMPLHKRLYDHKNNYKRFINGGKVKYITSFKLFELDDDVKIELIEKVCCNEKCELLQREGHHIRNNVCVNKVIPDRTHQEYCNDNREKILEQSKEYYKNNRDVISDYKKEYHKNNKEKLNDYSREYYKDNREKMLEKTTCICGSIVIKQSLNRHLKTLKHDNYIKSTIQTIEI